MKKLILLFGVLFAFASISIAADSELVKAAKKEKERREKVEAKKVLTNQDIEEIRKKQLGIESQAVPADETETEKEGEDKTKKKAEKDPTQTEEYWRARKQETTQELQDAEAKVQQLQDEINTLTTAFYAESDGVAQRPLIESERIERLKELEQAKQDLERAREQSEGLEDEARKAGALPGWVRD